MRLHSACSKRILEMNITAKADFLISGKFVRPVFRNEFSPLPLLLAFTISPNLALSLKHPYRYDNFSRSTHRAIGIALAQLSAYFLLATFLLSLLPFPAAS